MFEECKDIRVVSLDNADMAAKEIIKIGSHPKGVELMTDKALFRVVKLEGIDSRAANIIKQEALSVGADAAVSKDVAMFSTKNSDILIMATLKQHKAICEKLEKQPFGLKKLSSEIKRVINNYEQKFDIVEAGKYKFDFKKKTYIMGILNVTPDSFSDGGRYTALDLALKRAEEIQSEGADIIDIGAESTRQGSSYISTNEELERLISVVEKIKENIDLPISVDTYKSTVAEEAIKSGALIINDISGFKADSKMAETAARYNAISILMHMRGTPQTMQDNLFYGDIISDLFIELQESIRIAKEAGLDEKKIIIDPGIGFSKNLEQNIEIMKKISEFKSLGYPILIGVSRKSIIGKILEVDIKDRLEGSIACALIGVNRGASIVRVHDVKESVRAMKMADALK